MPDAYTMPAHFHPTDERIEVKQGTGSTLARRYR
jgi:hypothetical protein